MEANQIIIIAVITSIILSIIVGFIVLTIIKHKYPAILTKYINNRLEEYKNNIIYKSNITITDILDSSN